MLVMKVGFVIQISFTDHKLKLLAYTIYGIKHIFHLFNFMLVLYNSKIINSCISIVLPKNTRNIRTNHMKLLCLMKKNDQILAIQIYGSS